MLTKNATFVIISTEVEVISTGSKRMKCWWVGSNDESSECTANLESFLIERMMDENPLRKLVTWAKCQA